MNVHTAVMCFPEYMTHTNITLSVYIVQECSISEKEWVAKIRSTLKLVHNIEYEKIASQTLWGIRLIILIKLEHTNKIAHIQGSQVRTGIGNALGEIKTGSTGFP